MPGEGEPADRPGLTAALPEMAADLKASQTVTNLTVAMYMLAMSIFPLWW